MSDVLAGVDLAWAPQKNGSAIALGELHEGNLSLTALHTGVIGLETVQNLLQQQTDLQGLAIDAPLIINNTHGARNCEQQLNAIYRSRWAGCHPSNLSLYPNAGSVTLAEHLQDHAFEHLGKPGEQKWQLECYPHPSLIELFSLTQRLAYKKGNVEQRKAGQAQLATHICTLQKNTRLSLTLAPVYDDIFNPQYIHSLRGQALKNNEDALDAVICLYIAGLYAVGQPMQVFGETRSGYIVVPAASDD
tara:strand:- start:196040 stop:196780 length:741 start_codon:yes stop_codon:yes gene_type:complete